MGKSINSRQKGKRGELEARDEIRRLWHAPTLIRAAQACGAWAADLIGALPCFHFEVKRYARISAADFMKQAVDDKNEGQIPVVVMRENQGEWLVIVRLEDTPAFAEELRSHLSGACEL